MYKRQVHDAAQRRGAERVEVARPDAVDGDGDGLATLSAQQQRQIVAVSVDGAWTGNLHTLTAAPLRRVVYDVAPGDHVIGFRYVDPATGRQGRVSSVTLHVRAR